MSDAAEAARLPLNSRALPPPSAITEVGVEIKPGSPEIWEPSSYAEWEGRERTRAFLAAWSEQMSHERDLRSLSAKCVFGLVVAQVIGTFGLVAAQGAGWLILDISVIKVLIPSVFTEVFGLGFVVVKYLFSQPLRHGLDTLITGAGHGH